MTEIFGRDDHARKAAMLVKVILEAGSLRLSDLSQVRLGTSPDATDKAIPRFLKEVDPREPLWRLFAAEAPFSIGGVTEVERPSARRPRSGGRLSDGKTPGFWLLVLGQPSAGRAIPLACVCDSEKILNQDVPARHLEPQRLFSRVGENPWLGTGRSATGGFLRPGQPRGERTLSGAPVPGGRRLRTKTGRRSSWG